MTPKMGFEQADQQEQIRLGELLWDVHAAGMKIVEFTTGRDYADFDGSELLQSVIASMLGIISNALTQLQADYPAEFARISNGHRLIGAVVPTAQPSLEKLWRLAEEQIPELVAESRAVLEDWHQA